ncbi:hypothetical protein PX699_18770 [Sphingobium sp. H39-3-25]|uniref:hypothetical protein n=1 Tax=Sphingobium arseniciresistens TaxID=3030834 RepID=UPI0023B8CA1E|nr:hypothetical protein [Sphingobium arseniciresistens]
MVPQGQLFVASALRHDAAPALEALLATMNHAPGQADPDNDLVPFGRIAQLHVARFVILDDPSLPDRLITPTLPVHEPTRLAFVADFDDGPDGLIADLIAVGEAGLRRIFSHCTDFGSDTDLGQWINAHRVRSAATYANWRGRSVVQVREEAALHRALRSARIAHPGKPPEQLWPILHQAGAAVALTPLPRRSIGWHIREAGHFLLLPVIALLLAPILLPLLPFLAILLRWRERRDPVIAPTPSRPRNRLLSALEDHDITNQYSAIGSLKPGLFRRWLTIVILWIINWGARHIYNKGRLGRVNTIHFASWTFLDDRRRVYFASNYDGSREAYNDDFINKVAFGLNLSFSNGLGYPRTRWLILGGARHEQDFKRYLFHHQIPTQVWYKAAPGLTTYDMARNTRIRRGFENPPTGKALRQWIAEI